MLVLSLVLKNLHRFSKKFFLVGAVLHVCLSDYKYCMGRSMYILPGNSLTVRLTLLKLGIFGAAH